MNKQLQLFNYNGTNTGKSAMQLLTHTPKGGGKMGLRYKVIAIRADSDAESVAQFSDIEATKAFMKTLEESGQYRLVGYVDRRGREFEPWDIRRNKMFVRFPARLFLDFEWGATADEEMERARKMIGRKGTPKQSGISKVAAVFSVIVLVVTLLI